MSLQLILYPQNYKGQFTSTLRPVNPTQNYIADSFLFSSFGLNGNAAYYSTSAQQPAEDAVSANSPIFGLRWYGFYTTGGGYGTVAAPTQTNNSLVLAYNASPGHCGVFQQIMGLSDSGIGQYRFEINIDALSTGTVYLRLFNSQGVLVDGRTFPMATSGTTLIWDFTSPDRDPIVSIDYVGTAANLVINTMSVKASPANPPAYYANFDDGQVAVDLYEEESIPLTLSADNFFKAGEQTKSYSKSFDLPATKRNNKIFDNMFDVTRADDGVVFNPYLKTLAILKQDSLVVFEGYLKLTNVKDVDGEISYTVNLFSLSVSLADTLKTRTFNDIDFEELEHQYDRSNIVLSWTDGVYLDQPLDATSFANNGPNTQVTKVIKYPYIDWSHNIYQPGGGIDFKMAELETGFRPCLSLKYLIQKIFSESGYSYTSDFFDGAEFNELYMDFNWGSNRYGGSLANFSRGFTQEYKFSDIGDFEFQCCGWKTVPFTSTVAGVSTDWDNTNYRFTCPTNNTDITFDWSIRVVSTATVYTYSCSLEIAYYNSDGVYLGALDHLDTAITSGSTETWEGSVSQNMNAGEYLKVRYKVSTSNKIRLDASSAGLVTFTLTADNAAATPVALLYESRGDLNQWDFFQGLMKMFNLIILDDPTKANNLVIEPYDDLFSVTAGDSLQDRSINYDWTEKVDMSKMEIKPVDTLSRYTHFRYAEDDDDYAYNVFKKAIGSNFMYGAFIRDSGFTALDGTEEISATPFAASVMMPLRNGLNFIVPTLYTMEENGETKAFDNSPRIFYNNGVKTIVNASPTGSSTYRIPLQNGVAAADVDTYLQFSHLSTVPTTNTTQDYLFWSHQLNQEVGAPPVNNLYSRFWSKYINELYHPDTRIVKVKANLEAADVAGFKFTEFVYIKNRAYRVNKIDYKPYAISTLELILIP